MKEYTRRTKDSTQYFCCSKKCAAVRTKEILIEKYGVSNISQVPQVKEKIKKTCLEKYGSENYISSQDRIEKSKSFFLENYGVDNYTKTEEYIQKVKESNLKKWGTDWYLQSNDKKEKSKTTSIKKYGFEFPSKSEEIKNKIKSTNVKKYGFNCPLQNKEILEKSHETLKINYGVLNPSQSPEIRDRTKLTCLERYEVLYPTQSEKVKETRKNNLTSKLGVEAYSQNEEFRNKNFYIANHEEYLQYCGNSVSLFFCKKCNNQYKISTDNFFSRKKNNIPLCTECNPIDEHRSIKEKELIEFVEQNYKGEIITSYRDRFEIDIYLPELKIGFEFNGLYFHSDKFKEKDYHLVKLNHFYSKGIRIINIWEDDWIFRNQIIKSQIYHLLSLSKKIGARKCEVREIYDNKITRDFLNSNHIQGDYSNIIKSFGLYYNNELISIMTFDHFEGRKRMSDNQWNLSRFCNKLGTTVVGGGSKILRHFIDKYNPDKIISYADKDWSQGNLYEKLNFIKLYETKPDYKYLIDGVRKHKSSFRKSKTGLSESKNGLFRVWDCGKIKYYLKLSQ